MGNAPRRRKPDDKPALGDKIAALTALINSDHSGLTGEQHRLAGAMLAAFDEQSGGKVTRAAAAGQLPPAATRAVRDANVCRTPFIRTPKRRRSHLHTLVALTNTAHRAPRTVHAGRRDARPSGRRARSGSAARGAARSGDSGSDGPGPPDDDPDGPPAAAAARQAGVGAGPSTPRWRGHCTSCHRLDAWVEPRREHHERVLCDHCAGRPAPASTVDPQAAARARAEVDATKAADPRPGLAVDLGDLDRWERDRTAGTRAARRHAGGFSPRAFAAVRNELHQRYGSNGFPIIDRDGDELFPCPACGHRPDVALAPLMLHRSERRISCATGCTTRTVIAALTEGCPDA